MLAKGCWRGWGEGVWDNWVMDTGEGVCVVMSTDESQTWAPERANILYVH